MLTILALGFLLAAGLLTNASFVFASDGSVPVPVTLERGFRVQTVMTSAPDVGALLEQQGVQLGPKEVVHPSLADPIVAGETIRITRFEQWNSVVRTIIRPQVIHRFDYSLGPGIVKVLSSGRTGIRETRVRYTRTDGILRKRVFLSKLLRVAQARVIIEGIKSRAIVMLATAYTAQCAGCSGYTAIGVRAGRGIVAVDPRIIPLGTKLFIPGYGYAIAGDTGGAIVGNRIDLGFNSFDDAMSFGRRVIKVYTIR